MERFLNHAHMVHVLQKYIETYFIPEENRYGGPSIRVRSANVSCTTGEPVGLPTIHFEGVLNSSRGLTLTIQGELLEEDLLKWSMYENQTRS